MIGERSGESAAARSHSQDSSARGAIAGALLRGIDSRRLLSAGALILTALAVGSAVLGPAFQVSVVRSYVVSRIDATPAIRTGLSWSFDPTMATASGGAQAVMDVAVQRAAEAVGDFAPPESSIETARFPALGGAGLLMAREGACDHVAVRGRCPTNPREVLVAAGDLETNDLQIGQLISSTSTDVPPLEVVGSYTVPEVEQAFWFDLDRLVSRPQMPSRAPNVPDLPYRPAPFLTDLSTFALVAPSLWQVRVDRRVDLPGSADAAALDLAAATAAELQTAPVSLPEGTWRAVGINDLPGIAEDVRRQREVAAATVQPSVISLVLVALALLLRLTLAATEQRRAELALAGLRGLAARRLWLLGLAEPLAVLVVAAPIGVIAGWLGLTVLTRLWLVPGLDITLPAASWVGAGIVLAAGVAVAVVAVGAVMRQTLAGQLTGVRRPVASGRVVMATRLVVLAVAVAAVVTQLAVPAGTRPDALALALPVLVALAAGLVATTVVTAAARWWVDRPGSGRRIPGWVASRAVSRRSEATVIVLPLSVAVAVAVFAAGVFGAAAAWRASVAATIAPGEVVWSSPLTMSESVDLTHRLDPDGRHLMALAIVPSVGVRVVAADTERLAAVVDWPDQWTPGVDAATVADLLAPRGKVPEIAGSRVSLTLDRSELVTAEPVFAELRFQPPGGSPVLAYVGPFGPGESSRSAEVSRCADGCRWTGITIGGRSARAITMAGAVDILDLRVDDVEIPGAVADAGWGRSDLDRGDSSPVDVTPAGEGITVELASEEASGDAAGAGARIRLSSGGLPVLRPVVVGEDSVDTVVDLADGTGASQVGQVTFDQALVSASLPLIGRQGVLIDFTMLSNDRPLFEDVFTVRVVSNRATPDQLTRGLREAGMTVETTRAAERQVLDQAAYALVLRLYAVVAALVLLMALASLLVTMAVQLPSRRRDAAALRVVGVRRGALVWATVWESLAVLTSAVVAGLAAGALAQYLVLSTLTLGIVEDISAPHPPVDVQVGSVALLAFACGVIMTLIAVGGALATVRGAHGASLRETAR